MRDNIKILNSKLTAPYAADTIKRGRLLAKIDQSQRKRLSMIVAGAGYGKTTLVAQAEPRWNIKTVWYRLDESDRDLVTFFSYLTTGIRKNYPEFGAATLECMRISQNPANELQRILTTFLNELEGTIHSDFVIVLDDYHSVNDSQEIKEAIEVILRDLSPFIHLVLISRCEPGLSISRLRAMREVNDIRENDLVFSAEETEQLYSEVFNFPLDHNSIGTICDKLGGWVSGLILLCHSFRGRSPLEIEKDLSNLMGSRKAIFSYLEENIYSTLPVNKQDFLLKTSILSSINPVFCDSLLNISYSSDVLRYLETNHLFTCSLDGEGQWYSYHQLFRDFLLSKLKNEWDHASIARLYRDAALLFEGTGDEDEAVGYYLHAGEYERACSLLKHAGRRLFREGRFQLLSSHLSSIPLEFMGDHPWIQFQQAQLEGLCGKLQTAVQKYDRALNCFIKQRDREGIQSCLVESGLIDFQTGDLNKAQDKFNGLIEQPDLDPELRIEIIGYLIYIASHFGHMELAGRWFDEGISHATLLDDAALRNRCLIWLYYYQGFRYALTGDFHKVLDAAETMRAVSCGSQPGEVPAGYHLLVSMACYHLRLHSRGYECARQALTLLEEGHPQSGRKASAWPSPRLSLRGQRGFPDAYRCWLLGYTALNASELGYEARALEDAEASLRCFREMGCRYGEPFAYSVLHDVYLKAGHRAVAERHARSGLEVLQGKTMPAYEALLRLKLAGSLVEKGETAKAAQLLADADGHVRELMKPVSLNLLLARLYWSDNRSAAGLAHLAPALEICQTRELDHVLISEQHWIVPLLVEMWVQGNMQGYITGIVSKMGPEASAQLSLLKRTGDSSIRRAASHLLGILPRASDRGLQVHCLGKFRVINGAGEIPSTAWRSSKARALFQYLIYSRPRGYTNKEILMELLWPEEDPALTAKRFHVALASLRKTLEPDIEKGVSSAFISRVGDSYRIDLGMGGWTDLERFTEELGLAGGEQDPQSSMAHLLRAESLYHGDFLQEEPYSEWCLEVRDKYRRDYLQVLKRMADHYQLQGDYANAIEYCRKYLEVDEYAEDVYRSLMVLYSENGDKLRMGRIYRKCKESITRELNCPLSDETEQLYRKLLAKGQQHQYHQHD